LEPHETKTTELQLTPNIEGTIIVRPIVLMWTDSTGQVRQATTPETPILVQGGTAIAAPVLSTRIVAASESEPEAPEIVDESLYAEVAGTGFGAVHAAEVAVGKEYGPGTVSAHKLRLLPEMRARAGHEQLNA
jgi:hypothetical protein